MRKMEIYGDESVMSCSEDTVIALMMIYERRREPGDNWDWATDDREVPEIRPEHREGTAVDLQHACIGGYEPHVR